MKALVADIMESTMQLVVDPLAHSLTDSIVTGGCAAGAADHTLLLDKSHIETATQVCRPLSDAAKQTHDSWRLLYTKQSRAGAIGMRVMQN